MPQPAPQYIAASAIRTSRFVTATGNNNEVAESNANERIVAVSREYSDRAQLDGYGAITPYAAGAAGDPVPVYGMGEICLLVAGDTINAGNLLKSDADGAAVPIATTGTTIQNVGAIAQEDAAAGELFKAQVHVMSERPALT